MKKFLNCKGIIFLMILTLFSTISLYSINSSGKFCIAYVDHNKIGYPNFGATVLSDY